MHSSSACIWHSLCLPNNLLIGDALFPYETIYPLYKLTWCSTQGCGKDQIDYVLIHDKWRGSLRGFKVRRGADVATDHHLVTAGLKLK